MLLFCVQRFVRKQVTCTKIVNNNEVFYPGTFPRSESEVVTEGSGFGLLADGGSREYTSSVKTYTITGWRSASSKMRKIFT